MIDFCHQQDIVHRWANEVHLDPWMSREYAAHICNHFQTLLPDLLWEQRGYLGSLEAATVRNARTGGLQISFAGWGTTLLVLAHELVHCVRPWEEPHHDALDWDLTCLMLELTRDLDV